MPCSDGRATIAVAVCTFRRNEPLRVLLGALVTAAETVAARAAVGVVIVDDNEDGAARVVVDEFASAFELGVRYEHSGARNISIARNRGLESAAELAEWVAMTDDDCEPDPQWLASLLDTVERFGADCVTGPMVPRLPSTAPRWLTTQPFTADVPMGAPDGERLDVAQTNNSMISTRFLVDHPDVRFDPRFGVLGGEDMVFYRSAVQLGLHVRHAASAVVWANEPPSRATFRHQVRYRYWLGNSEGLTNLELAKATRLRLVARAARRIAAAAARPVQRLVRRDPPQVRYAVASMAGACGMLAAVAGVRVAHPQD